MRWPEILGMLSVISVLLLLEAHLTFYLTSKLSKVDGLRKKKPKVERMNSLENKPSGTYSTAGTECKESVLQTSKG